MADFMLVARRTLDDLEYRLFRFHFLLGADWKLCSRRLKLDRGMFFHAVYRIEEKLGRAYRELEPYSLYPLDEYFNTSIDLIEPFERRRERAMPVRPSVFNRNRRLLRSA